jgi:regulator of replication initiation timing
VHCSKDYYGDTLSTLMFAKRAKILKMRVELNENLTENFDSLRKEVRRLREELAEARYFKDVQKTERTSFYQDF